ncbi:tripartite motif-containing protein 16-like [Astyanax mexicanus]|uniref:tripartite motif-containing protein 16-like n=1 Tax=Astyanax mexicanus TaxID=7994 RepID=UPI0020CB15E6|nr:tripartite motif-containing protein 16-like [Astyanax mexicanus]
MEETDEEISGQTLDVSAAAAEVSAAGVECDACEGRKRKAEQTCLECLASYCEPHLDLHNRLHGGKRHKLVEATEKLQEITCPKHGKLLEVFCRTDQQCICYLCITNAHRTHDVISIEVEVAEAHMKTGMIQREIANRVKTREKEVQVIQQAVEAFKILAENAVEKSERLFREMIQSMQERQCTVKDMIRAQEEDMVKKATEVLGRLQEELGQLQRRDAKLHYLKEISQANQNILFLLRFLSVPALLPSMDAAVFFVHPYSSFEFSAEAVADLIKQLEHICQSCFTTISENVREAVSLPAPALKTREDFLQYACKLTLNLNTAHVSLRLSKENKEVTAVVEAENYLDHPDRFDCRAQILCNEGLQGKSPQYWEVEFGGRHWVCIAVSYIGIRRKGKNGPLFGRNQDSWGLRCCATSYHFWHKNKSVTVDYEQPCSKIGVYLDHEAGVLAFYNVVDSMSLIYKVQTKFTEPVHAGFGLAGKGTHVKLCNVNEDDVIEEKTLFSYFSTSRPPWMQSAGTH